MNASRSSLWNTLDTHGDRAIPSGHKLYTLLSERAKVENTRPRRITHAEMDTVVEDVPLIKKRGITSKANMLNTTYFVLKNPTTNQYFRLDEKETFLWNHMDGNHTIKDLAIAYFSAYGTFAYDKIVELVYDLKKKTFLTEPYEHLYETLSFTAKSKQWIHGATRWVKKLLYWEVPIPHVETFFTQLYRTGGRILFHPVMRLSLILIALAGFGVFVWLRPAPSTNILLFLVLNFVSLMVHELAHGLATVRFGREVHKAGFLLYFGIPAFFVDTTDMWMEEKPKRIAVTTAGIIAQAITAGIASILLLAPLPPLIHGLLATFAGISYLSIFVNMNPLIEWDGYFVLMDLVGIPCLRKRSLHFIEVEIWKKVRNRHALGRDEWLYAIFGALSAGWSILAILFALNFWRTHIAGLL